MLRIENAKVYDLSESIVAAGYAMGLNLDDFKGRAENLEKWTNRRHYDYGWFTEFLKKYESMDMLGYSFMDLCQMHSINDEKEMDSLLQSINDVKRMMKLVQASKHSKNVKCHHNALTGIRVSFDLIYPNYISPEMQRYHWFDIVTSSSKMHRLMKMDFSKCCNKYVTEETKANMVRYIEEYNQVLNTPVPASLSEGEKHKKDVYEAFMKVLSNCPQGIELFMRVSTNYMQLQTMYFQRKDHRLKEDWGYFCKFVENLPLAQELIIGEYVNKG